MSQSPPPSAEAIRWVIELILSRVTDWMPEDEIALMLADAKAIIDEYRVSDDLNPEAA